MNTRDLDVKFQVKQLAKGMHFDSVLQIRIRLLTCGFIRNREYKDLVQGQRYLRDLVERQDIPVFDEVTVAVESIAAILNEKPRTDRKLKIVRWVKSASNRIKFKIRSNTISLPTISNEERRTSLSFKSAYKDVYLGGSDVGVWRETLAIPMLK